MGCPKLAFDCLPSGVKRAVVRERRFGHQGINYAVEDGTLIEAWFRYWRR